MSTKTCETCGRTFARPCDTDGRPRRKGAWRRQRYCSQLCARVQQHGSWKRDDPPWIVETDTGCWIWQRALARGYGHLRRHTRDLMAHVWLYELLVGPIPEGMQLDHVVCQNRACVNPAHVEPVTSRENTRRGRATKLNPARAAEIRAACEAGRTGPELAREYGVSPSTIYSIKLGRSWNDSE